MRAGQAISFILTDFTFYIVVPCEVKRVIEVARGHRVLTYDHYGTHWLARTTEAAICLLNRLVGCDDSLKIMSQGYWSWIGLSYSISVNLLYFLASSVNPCVHSWLRSYRCGLCHVWACLRNREYRIDNTSSIFWAKNMLQHPRKNHNC